MVIVSCVVATVLAVVGGALAYFQFQIKPNLIRSAVSSAKPPPPAVTAEQARDERWNERLRSIGTIIAVPGIDVASEVPGLVTDIKFKSGTEVTSGATLVQLDDSIDKADLASNQATLQQAQLDFVRQQDLAKRDVASAQTFEAAQAKRDTAAAAVQRSRAVIAQKNIKAPFAGRVGIRNVDLGQYVGPGTPLVSLQALDPIFVDFTLPEEQLNQIKPGQPVSIKLDAFPDRDFKGEVAVVDARLDQSTHSIKVRARFANADRSLLPGMFADVTVVTSHPESVVTVPRTAVSYSLYGDSVFVIGSARRAEAGNNTNQGNVLTAERRPVKLGATRGDRVAIASGIKPGEIVATSGQLKLQNGGPVRIDNRSPLKPPPVLPLE
ncbi:MAG: efflux RND transporter periplasmic adaptor subunit [Proteobacteria bacterium]|nr:efflux RND transporter periplasmic adaptor subunit [Pseudomonadota bacterium]